MLASKFCVVVNKCPMFNREQMPNIQLKFASSRLLCSLRCYNSRFMLCSPVFNREQMSNIQLKFASSRLLCSLRCYNSRFMLCSPMFNHEQNVQHTAQIRLFEASPQLALLQFSLYVVLSSVRMCPCMRACRSTCSTVLFCSLKKRP